MGIFSIQRFFNYYLFSRHRYGHGIHSPFVFDLVSNIFRNKIDSDIVFTIEMIRKKLIADRRLIMVNDLGAGSKRMKTSLRKVSDIVRYSSVSKKYGILLSNMAAAFGNSFILEFGTSFGISTMYMAASSPGAKVVTMEGCRAISEIALMNFKEAGLTNIGLLNGPFDSLLPGIKSENRSPDLVFIDGDHRKEAVIRYFRQVADMSDSRTVIVVDDIYSSSEMAEAWIEIKNHENVTLSIDIFRMGIIFFRKDLNHINYVVRY